LEAAQFAPSAANKQPFKFFIFEKRDNLQLRKVYDRDWFVSAPLIIFGCVNEKEAWERMDKKNYAIVDLTIALDHLVLAATEQGLGTCWIANFNPKEAKKFLSVSKEFEPIIIISIGYPNCKSQEKIRKKKEEIVFFKNKNI